MIDRMREFFVWTSLFAIGLIPLQAEQAKSTKLSSLGDKVAKGDVPLSDACKQPNAPPIYLLETRAPERFTQNLLIVDGLSVERDITLVVCKDIIKRQAKGTRPISLTLRVRHKPRDGDWRDIDAYQASRENEVSSEVQKQREPEGAVLPFLYRVALNAANEPVFDPIVVIPLRRLPTRPDDAVRVIVAINETEQALDATFKVDKFGVHASFFDSVMFIQRWGEDNANRNGKSDVQFASVNFHPAPSINYGFTYYNRRSSILRFLEPGFGASASFLGWDDRSKLLTLGGGPPATVPAPAGGTMAPATSPVQVGVGVMGSMFDNVVVATIGWNLNVRDQRSYFGIGVSVTGLARKFSRYLR
jgi:hypothetical protein